MDEDLEPGVVLPTNNTNRGDTLMRIVVFPGSVKSKSDGDYHFVSSASLLTLYNINHCWDDVVVVAVNNRQHRRRVGDIELRPRYSGDYNQLPKPLTEGDE